MSAKTWTYELGANRLRERDRIEGRNKVATSDVITQILGLMAPIIVCTFVAVALRVQTWELTTMWQISLSASVLSAAYFTIKWLVRLPTFWNEYYCRFPDEAICTLTLDEDTLKFDWLGCTTVVKWEDIKLVSADKYKVVCKIGDIDRTFTRFDTNDEATLIIEERLSKDHVAQ